MLGHPVQAKHVHASRPSGDCRLSPPKPRPLCRGKPSACTGAASGGLVRFYYTLRQGLQLSVLLGGRHDFCTTGYILLHLVSNRTTSLFVKLFAVIAHYFDAFCCTIRANSTLWFLPQNVVKPDYWPLAAALTPALACLKHRRGKTLQGKSKDLFLVL